MQIEPLEPSDIPKAVLFLNRYEDSSQFLLGNLQSHGPVLTEASNSGNFYLIRTDNKIAAIFCLTRRGNLLIQTDREADYTSLIYGQVSREPLHWSGVLGDWNLVEPIWHIYRSTHPHTQAKFISKEILYSLSLSEIKMEVPPANRARLMNEKDFDAWNKHNTDFLKEMGLNNDLTQTQKHANFRRNTAESKLWGLFEDQELLSMAGLNARSADIGQVGGVYTPPSERGKGYSKRTMMTLMQDCAARQQLRKIILFTGENNRSAQRLYEGLGYRRIGHFGIIFW